VQVNQSRRQLPEAKTMGLHRNAPVALENATLYAEGKWLFAPVRTEADLKDAPRLGHSIKRRNLLVPEPWR